MQSGHIGNKLFTFVSWSVPTRSNRSTDASTVLRKFNLNEKLEYDKTKMEKASRKNGG
jgi:hypothetical protein